TDRVGRRTDRRGDEPWGLPVRRGRADVPGQQAPRDHPRRDRGQHELAARGWRRRGPDASPHGGRAPPDPPGARSGGRVHPLAPRVKDSVTVAATNGYCLEGTAPI